MLMVAMVILVGRHECLSKQEIRAYIALVQANRVRGVISGPETAATSDAGGATTSVATSVATEAAFATSEATSKAASVAAEATFAAAEDVVASPRGFLDLHAMFLFVALVVVCSFTAMAVCLVSCAIGLRRGRRAAENLVRAMV